MKNLKLLPALFVAAVVMALPAVSMAQEERHDDRRTAEQDAHPARGWHRGDHVPATYLDNRYVVSDWSSHHLRQPPAGYQWVQVNGDFVLAAIATGVIADVMLSQ